MNVGSLFSGIGGIDLGLERAGHTVVFQAEADEWRRSVLAERFGGVPIYEDVHQVNEASWSSRRSAGRRTLGRESGDTTSDTARSGLGRPGSSGVDLLCGGFPCQDLSVAGQRRGLMHEGGRSNLFFEFARIADELVQPGGHVLIENVPGLLSSNGGRDFAVLLATLAELGFHDLAWRILDSRHFGVPQRRRRVFVLGRRARGDRCAQVLLESESGGGHFAASGEAREAASVASLSGLGSGGPDDNDGQAGRIVPALTTRSGNTQDDQQTTQLVAGTLRSHTRPGSNNSTDILQDSAVRRLTPRECERLQGFPDDWTALGPDSRRYAALGDAVTVPVAEWIGRRLAA